MSPSDSNNILHTASDPSCTPDPRGMGVLFMEKMKQYSENVAQIDAETGEMQTYGEVLLRSIRVAQAMKERGLKANDIITLCSCNHMDCVLPFLAALYLGVHVSSLDPTLPKSDAEHLLNLVKPSLIFCGQECVPLIDNAIDKIGLDTKIVVYGDTTKYMNFSEFLIPTGTEENFEARQVDDIFDTAAIFFSSGTTGLPKAVCVNHNGLLKQQNYLLKGADVSRVMYFTTFYWISAVMLLTMAILKGGARVICKQFSENETFEIIEKYKVSYSFMAPFHISKLLSHHKTIDVDTSHLKILIIGGGKVNKEHMKTIKTLLPNTCVMICYGMTECSGCTTVFNPATDKEHIDNKLTSCGRQIPGIVYKVVDIDTEEILGENRIGEIRLKSDVLMNGYYNDPKTNRSAWDSEGYLHTGDVGYYDSDHCFFVVDRIKDVMKFQSWHIIPMELEDILLSHPDVKEAAVVGRPHEIDGEHPMAFVLLKEEAQATKNDIMTYFEEHIAGADRKKLRGGIKIVDYIPRTPTGKIRRGYLKHLYLIN